MKVFAVQKAQVNIGASQFNQNHSAVKTNSAGDKFVSKNVSFGTKVSEMRKELAKLEEQLAKTLSESKRREIRTAITKLQARIDRRTSEGGSTTSAAQHWIEQGGHN